MKRRIIFLAFSVLTSCEGPAEAPAPVVTPPPVLVTPPPAVIAPTVPAPAPTPSAVRSSEISVAAEKTTRGGQVLAIGRPRFRLGPTWRHQRGLLVRVATHRALALDRAESKQWDLDTGLLLDRQVRSLEEDPLLELVASSDGTWIGVGDFYKLTIYQSDKPISTVRHLEPHVFIGSTLLGESDFRPTLVDAASGRLIEQLPDGPFPGAKFRMVLGGDGGQVWWISEVGLSRWRKGDAAFSTVVRAPKKWENAKIALRAPIAVVRQSDGLYRVDLVTGAMRRITSGYKFAVSPTGNWVANVGVDGIRVLETATSREVATLRRRDVDEAAFAEVDDVLAFHENGTIRVADIANQALSVRATPAASRFLGWIGNGVASIQHEGTTQEIDVTTGAISASTRTPVAPAASPVLAIKQTAHEITVRAKGSVAARIQPEAWDRAEPGIEQTYWKTVASPTGTDFLVWIVRPDQTWREPPRKPFVDLVPDPPSDPLPCFIVDSVEGCVLEYIAELWSLEGGAHRVWRARPDNKDPTWRMTALGTRAKGVPGPMAFSPDGRWVLIGYDDGDVLLRTTDASATNRIEALHRAPITRIDVDPGSHWVFTEDAEGEQRIWPL